MSLQKRTRLGLVATGAGINTALLPGCEGERRGRPSAEEAAPAVRVVTAYA